MEARRRAERDLQLAKKRLESKETKQQKDAARELRFKEMQRKLTEKTAALPRSKSQLLAQTAASRGQQLSIEALDLMEHRRAHSGAHAAPVAGGGYDLKFVGRAIPAWVRPEIR